MVCKRTTTTRGGCRLRERFISVACNYLLLYQQLAHVLVIEARGRCGQAMTQPTPRFSECPRLGSMFLSPLGFQYPAYIHDSVSCADHSAQHRWMAVLLSTPSRLRVACMSL
jgi:hypothetical protein